MACILNAGVTLGCRENTGGLSKIYIGTYTGSTSWTVDSGHTITAVTGYNAFYSFDFPSETVDAVETGNFSKENQTVFYEQVVNCTMYSTSQTTRDALALLGMARVFVIVKDNNNQFFLYGKNDGMWLTSANISTGKAYGDLNGITVAFTGRETDSANVVAASVLTTLGW